LVQVQEEEQKRSHLNGWLSFFNIINRTFF